MIEEPLPRKPGWYWDPQEFEHNEALRERWRRQIILTEPASYRLRRWDGTQWTGETLADYTLRGPGAVPHFIGPSTRIDPLTPEQAAQNLKIWALLMAIGTLACVVSLIVR